MIFQQFNLVGRLDVLTNVLMGRLAEMPSWRSLTQLWPEEDKALAMSALEQFDMGSLAAQRADQLSGGQLTVICNLHSLDLARSYCDRLIGMASGRIVFDGAPATLT